MQSVGICDLEQNFVFIVKMWKEETDRTLDLFRLSYISQNICLFFWEEILSFKGRVIICDIVSKMYPFQDYHL